MNKIAVTPLQRENALHALNVFWPSIQPEQVVDRLGVWRREPAPDDCEHDDAVFIDFDMPPTCGTLACFGGWAEWHRPFREQRGMDPDKGEMDIQDLWDLFGVTEHHCLTASRGYCAADEGFTGSDHELVSNRLRWLIANSEVAA